MKKILRLMIGVVSMTTVLNAGVIVDVKVGSGSQLDVTPTGSVAGYSLENDLGIESSAQTSTYVEFSHLIPIVPNIKYEMNTLNFVGTMTADATIGGEVYSTNVASKFSWDHQDVALYWGIPFSTWIPMIDAADFGFGVKLGDLTMGATGISDTTFDFGAIYGYGRMHVSPPFFMGIGIEVEMKKLSTTQDDADLVFSEMIYKLDWFAEAPIPVIDLAIGIEAGYKVMDYQLTVSGTAFDLGFSSYFFNIVGKFGI